MPNLLIQLRSAVRDDLALLGVVADPDFAGGRRASLHLAVFVEPLLRQLLCGEKTVESRFSTTGCAPFEQIDPGDVVAFKRAGGDVVGLGLVREAKHFRRPPRGWGEIRRGYQHQFGAVSSKFWERVESAGYATLIWFDRIKVLPPIKCDKRDRRGWVVVSRATAQLGLDF